MYEPILYANAFNVQRKRCLEYPVTLIRASYRNVCRLTCKVGRVNSTIDIKVVLAAAGATVDSEWDSFASVVLDVVTHVL